MNERTGLLNLTRAVIGLFSVCLLAVAPLDAVAGQRARELHLQAVTLLIKAGEDEQMQRWEQALEGLNEALSLYRELTSAYPEWLPEMVSERKERIRLQIEELSRLLDETGYSAEDEQAAAMEDEGRIDALLASLIELEERVAEAERKRNEEIQERLTPVLQENERLKQEIESLKQEVERMEAVREGEGEVAEDHELGVRLTELEEKLAEAERARRVEIRERLTPVLQENERLRKEIERMEAAHRADEGSDENAVAELRLQLERQKNVAVALERRLAEVTSRMGVASEPDRDNEASRRRLMGAEAQVRQLEVQVQEISLQARTQLERLRDTWQQRFEELREDAIRHSREKDALLEDMQRQMQHLQEDNTAMREEIEYLIQERNRLLQQTGSPEN